jgi:hypothetical protein
MKKNQTILIMRMKPKPVAWKLKHKLKPQEVADHAVETQQVVREQVVLLNVVYQVTVAQQVVVVMPVVEEDRIAINNS